MNTFYWIYTWIMELTLGPIHYVKIECKALKICKLKDSVEKVAIFSNIYCQKFISISSGKFLLAQTVL